VIAIHAKLHKGNAIRKALQVASHRLFIRFISFVG
jgi:hypothetical protein